MQTPLRPLLNPIWTGGQMDTRHYIFAYKIQTHIYFTVQTPRVFVGYRLFLDKNDFLFGRSAMLL